MPNNASNPLPPGEAAPASVSNPDDSVSEVNKQLETVKLSDQDEADATVGNQDEARPPSDAAVGDTNAKEDPDLWKPHPPTEECPVCLVPLPLLNTNRIYWTCCGKMLCKACCLEHERALRVTNMKREKKQPPLEKTCAFCRRPAHKNCAQLLRRYEARIAKDDTHAMLNLAYMFRDGCNCLRKDDAKASELLDRAAQLGSAEAIAELGLWVANGWLDSIPDRTKAKFFFEDAAKKGDVPSRYNLAKLWADEDNYDLAIKHWNLAAAAGLDESMNSLWKCFSKDKLSKVDLEKALRAHKASSDDMNSEERARYDAYNEARAGHDEHLKHIYTAYYAGFINPKELTKALKAHRAGDFGEVNRLVNAKILTSR